MFLLFGMVLASLGFATTAIGSHGGWWRMLTGTTATTTMTSTNPEGRHVFLCHVVGRDHHHGEGEFNVREVTIMVGQRAVVAHLRKGDELGECPPPGQTSTQTTTTSSTPSTSTTTATTTTASDNDQDEDDGFGDDDSGGNGFGHFGHVPGFSGPDQGQGSGQFPSSFSGQGQSQGQGSGAFTGTVSGQGHGQGQGHHDD